VQALQKQEPVKVQQKPQEPLPIRKAHRRPARVIEEESSYSSDEVEAKAQKRQKVESGVPDKFGMSAEALKRMKQMEKMLFS